MTLDEFFNMIMIWQACEAGGLRIVYRDFMGEVEITSMKYEAGKVVLSSESTMREDDAE